jgi:hypothetical protein
VLGGNTPKGLGVELVAELDEQLDWEPPELLDDVVPTPPLLSETIAPVFPVSGGGEDLYPDTVKEELKSLAPVPTPSCK